MGGDRIEETSRISAESAYEHRVLIAFVAIVLVFSWCGFHFADRYGLLVGFFTAAIFISLIYFFTDVRLSQLFDADEIEGTDTWGALRILRTEAGRLSIPVPRLFVVNAETPAFLSAGLFQSQSRIFVTTGALDRFARHELELLLAFEMEKISSHATANLTAVVSVANLLNLLASKIDALFAILIGRPRPRPRFAPRGPLTILTAPVVGAIVRLGIRRRLYFALDQRVAALRPGDSPAGQEVWAQLLWKLEAYNKTLPYNISLAEASLFLVNPLVKFTRTSRLYTWVSVQPRIEDRIRELVGRFPL